MEPDSTIPIPQDAPEPASCYHCGLPVPEGTDLQVPILGAPRPMCCRGCEAVARAIVDGGLEAFYRHRTDRPERGRELVPEFLQQARVYDNPQVQQSFVSQGEGNLREASLILEGISCAACIWLNEWHLAGLPGVEAVQINYATHRARVRWDQSRIRLSEILEAIAAIGYRAHPYDPHRQQELLAEARTGQLRRLGLTGALGMQVMGLALALYFGDWWGMEAQYQRFFHWISLLLAAPIVAYSARPFFTSAWRDLRHRRAGMDVPVSLGILGAFGASVWATVSGHGAVYFDSVAMFTFFLLGARYFELTGRIRANEAVDRLVRLAPATATRLGPGPGTLETVVPVAELAPGDRIRIRPGEPVPADATVLAGQSSADESLLTGESLPVPKGPGDPLVGGSLNVEGPLEARVDKVGQDTVLSHILRLLDQAQAEKPRVTLLADRAAGWFVLGVLVLAGGVGLYWGLHEPGRWLEITIAVLVVTCPCALSLATPTAVTAATGTLTRAGMLTTRGQALEGLARATHVIFDKTGTLTRGQPRLLQVHAFGDTTTTEALRIAAALERHSEHPIAQALVAAAGHTGPRATEVTNRVGHGLHGTVEGRGYWIGTPDFVTREAGVALATALVERRAVRGHTLVWLACANRLLAAFELGDEIRADAREIVQALGDRGIEIWLLSGDQPAATHEIGTRVGIPATRIRGGLTPEDKLAHLRALRAEDARVVMVGDGVNDVPVLAAAQVSIAMGNGAQISLATADLIVLGSHLGTLPVALDVARRTRRIIRENLAWAIVYNTLALPAAALGFVQPWMAAIGMSASSLLVVGNALRLTLNPNRRS